MAGTGAGAATYDIATDVGRVRLLVADTDTGDATFSDAEIEWALAAEDGVYRAAALLLRALAVDSARLAVRVSRGGVSEDLTQVAANLRAQADAYEAKANAGIPALSSVVSPSWEPFSATENLLTGRPL